MFAGELILRFFTVAGFIDTVADSVELAFEQQPVGGVVVRYQYRQPGQGLRPGGQRLWRVNRAATHPDRQRDGESGPHARTADHPQPALHQRNQLLANDQPQPGAGLLASLARLGIAMKEGGLLSFTDPAAAVANDEGQLSLCLIRLRQPAGDLNRALGGKLQRIADEIIENLPQRLRVDPQRDPPAEGDGYAARSPSAAPARRRCGTAATPPAPHRSTVG